MFLNILVRKISIVFPTCTFLFPIWPFYYALQTSCLFPTSGPTDFPFLPDSLSSNVSHCTNVLKKVIQNKSSQCLIELMPLFSRWREMQEISSDLVPKKNHLLNCLMCLTLINEENKIKVFSCCFKTAKNKIFIEECQNI